MRKIYETEADRQKEARVRQYLATAWDCDYEESPELSFVDCKLTNSDGVVAALVEIKTRTNASTKYPTYMLSAHKWRNALHMANEYRVPFMLVVQFTDGIYAAKIRNDYEIAKGGRTDRNDLMDIEDCVFIPMSDFRKV